MSGGRCFRCGSRIPAAYLVSELILASLFLLSFQLVGLTIALLPLLIALSVLLGLVWYDLRHMIIPTALSWLLLSASLVYAVLANPVLPELGYVFMLAGAIGLFFFLFHLLSGGRAMGLGDVPLALSLSLLAGPLAVSGLVYSFWVGGVIGIFLLLLRHTGNRIESEVPFAPFLAAGFLLALFTSWDILTLIGF